jgi:integrase
MATIRKRKDRWQAQVRRKGSSPVSKTFTLQKDAFLWARQMEIFADRGEIPSVQQKLAADSSLSDLLRHPISQKSLKELQVKDFANYRDERLKEISGASLRRQLNPIRHMFQIAINEWGIPLKAKDNRRERRLKDGEYERLLAAARTRQNPYIEKIVVFAIETGMRRGEILNLCWDQVDLKRRSVTILESKNGYSRTIPITQLAAFTLQSLSRGDARVFPTTANSLRLAWDRMLKGTGIEDLHFHDLRHEAISRFFEMGLTVPEVASISGHRDTRMLLRYAHADRGRILEKFAE